MLDSTCVSGVVLSKLPVGSYVGMVRHLDGIAIKWKLSKIFSPAVFAYYDVVTGEEISVSNLLISEKHIHKFKYGH